eukprot:TRINITY_DN28418_c0_g1_i1.p1 TRINITY_DN28418_c0_g1~~TRINITY_DN28418_c0_g1_i1.p1  ORF type:complete len:142 (+),score=0.91 TRINITY_DN28418_c0_g1_i1:160-585(+)
MVAERMRDIVIPEEGLEEADFLEEGTPVLVTDQHSAILFSFPDSLGVVVGYSWSSGWYTVRFLSSHRKGFYLWRAVTEIMEVFLHGLVQSKSLNGQRACVDGVVEGDIPRLRVTLRSGRCVSIRHTCARPVEYQDFYSHSA